MSHWTEDILSLSNKPITFALWNNVLTFFIVHKTQLDLEDIKIIVDKSEECRLYLNKHNRLHIERKEVSPNVYEYLEKIKSDDYSPDNVKHVSRQSCYHH